MNGKSLEFVKNRIASGRTNLQDNVFRIMEEVKFEFPSSMNSLVKDNGVKCILEGTLPGDKDKKELTIEIEYNPDAEFDYFTLERCNCDGTLTFFVELCDRIIQKLFTIGTYCLTAPEDFRKNPFAYDVKYTVGDYVFAEEFGDEFATEEKPWLQARFSVMLPIKFECWKREEIRYYRTYI